VAVFLPVQSEAIVAAPRLRIANPDNGREIVVCSWLLNDAYDPATGNLRQVDVCRHHRQRLEQLEVLKEDAPASDDVRSHPVAADDDIDGIVNAAAPRKVAGCRGLAPIEVSVVVVRLRKSRKPLEAPAPQTTARQS
jgi:hypothetical protein